MRPLRPGALILMLALGLAVSAGSGIAATPKNDIAVAPFEELSAPKPQPSAEDPSAPAARPDEAVRGCSSVL